MSTVCKNCGQPVEPSNETETRYVHTVTQSRRCGYAYGDSFVATPRERNYGHYVLYYTMPTCTICYCHVGSDFKVLHSNYHYEEDPRNPQLFKED